ncbi:hypothetical protein CEP54_002714 [Fusarium duplospermum]|uniref:Uncharacterized protein n=1 Tax=Fusarium duplospermum TaxID=1325734 RepID=A0A428QTZ2_9HYPO|nr:hypothetical protein CEP54_002714 [Fusarium duplospermum]
MRAAAASPSSQVFLGADGDVNVTEVIPPVGNATYVVTDASGASRSLFIPPGHSSSLRNMSLPWSLSIDKDEKLEAMRLTMRNPPPQRLL